MIYNLETNLELDIVKNGVYESLKTPIPSISEYLNRINTEIQDCPYLHAPDYDLLIPISEEIQVYNEGKFCGILPEVILDIAYDWWKDGYRV